MLFAYALLPFFTPYVAAPRAKHVNATPEYRGVNVIALFTNWHACIMLATCRNKRLFFTLSLHLFKSRLLVDIGHVVLLLSHFECMLAVESYVLCKIKQPNFKAGKISGEKLPHVIIEMSLHLFLLNEKAGPRKQHTHIPSYITMEGLSLSELFNRGQGAYISVQESNLASADPQLQSQIEQGIAFLERASDLVQRLGIFSENEFVDDINANDLRFLLVNAYLGSLVLQRTGANRKDILELSKVRNSIGVMYRVDKLIV